jgi:hypothetical protein
MDFAMIQPKLSQYWSIEAEGGADIERLDRKVFADPALEGRLEKIAAKGV